MRPAPFAAAALAAFVGSAITPAAAQSLGLTLGAHAPGVADGAASFGVEYRFAPQPLSGGWTGGWLLAARHNDRGDTWAGVGYGVQHPLTGRWHVEGSFAAGLYRAGATDLGHLVEFRTQIGLGLDLGRGRSVVLSAEHLSNGGLGAINPGTNLVSLGFRQVF